MPDQDLDRADTDGRHLRREKSRSLVVLGFLDLVRQTGTMPTMEAVADHTGVSRRSVFRHYADVSALLTAAYEFQREEVFQRFPRRDASNWSPEERVEAFIERASEIYEFIAPVRRILIGMANAYPALFALIRDDDSLQRSIVASLFADYFVGLPEAQARLYISSLVAASNWANWEGLRREQGLALEEARAVVRTLMRGVLAVAPP